MPDGTHYASRNGHIEVDNPHHADMISRSFEKGMGFIEGKLVIFSDAEGQRCSVCAFNAFLWSKACPRCSNPFTVPAEIGGSTKEESL